MAKGHDARSIANSLIALGVSNSAPRDPLQIIKLTYLCHGWMLGLYQEPLSEQLVEAWQYGPVIPSVYHAIKRYGKEPVYTPLTPKSETFDYREIDLIHQVYEGYKDFSGVELSRLTHANGTPWHKVWHEQGKNSVIPNKLIQEHFSELADDG